MTNVKAGIVLILHKGGKIMKFKVTFVNEFECENTEDCCDELIEFLNSCVINGDVTPFNFVELKHEDA